MVLLTLTPDLIAAIRRYNTLPTTSAGDSIDTDSPVSIHHHTVHRVSQALLQHANDNIFHDAKDSDPPSKSDKEKYRLNVLLKGCTVYIPPKPPKPEPTPEYKALMARLRAEAEAKEYASLVSGVSPEGIDDDFTMKDLKSQLSIIANVLLSTFATAVAVWMVASSWDVPERLALAFTTALVVCIAEVVIFGGYMRRMEEGKAREKNKKETKEVVYTWEIGTKGVVEKID
ncbi:Vacuolar ATPase assembly integral membrane protein [Rhizina undulata]